jgi:predicted transcriptional regulator
MFSSERSKLGVARVAVLDRLCLFDRAAGEQCDG